MSIKESLLQRLIGIWSQREETELPPEVSEKANYSYGNFRGFEPFSYGPRHERQEETDREVDIYSSGGRPQIKFCRY